MDLSVRADYLVPFCDSNFMASFLLKSHLFWYITSNSHNRLGIKYFSKYLSLATDDFYDDIF